MSIEGTQVYGNANWTSMYVLLGVIPVVFVAVVLYSLWQDRATRERNDFEMAAGQTFRRPRRFPWKGATAISEPGRSTATGPSYTRPHAPFPPPNFSKPSGSSNDERTGGHRRDRSTTQPYPAELRSREYEYGKSEPSGSRSKYSEDFRDVPL
ncbi:hypothetical protein F5Y06DRAFT_253882 [Hypoxylon sp. FL0890]|nr:hypothetical protein F5Y06DRAFT_253882 [Hypoxylon sp. FL0890]